MEQDIKVLFQYLHKELIEYQVRFVDVTIKGTGLSLLILGWLLTSESDRVFVATNTKGRLAAVIGVSLMEIAYIFLAVRMGWVMQHLGHEMDSLEYMPRSYYGYRALPPKVIFMNGTIAVAPGAAAIALIASSLSQVGSIEFELASDEVDHGDEIAEGSIAASFCLCSLNEAVDSFQ